jgi:hypothetical protein
VKHQTGCRVSPVHEDWKVRQETLGLGLRKNPPVPHRSGMLDVDVSPSPHGVGKRARASAVDAKGVKGMLSENVNKASTPMQPFCFVRTAGLVEPAVPPQQPPRDMVSSSKQYQSTCTIR